MIQVQPAIGNHCLIGQSLQWLARFPLESTLYPISTPIHTCSTLPYSTLHHILSWSSFHSLTRDHWLPCSRCQTSLVLSGSIGSLSLKRSLQASIPGDMRSRWRSLSEQDLKVILLRRSASEFCSIACICSVLCCSLWGLLCSALLSSAGCGH